MDLGAVGVVIVFWICLQCGGGVVWVGVGGGGCVVGCGIERCVGW